MLINFKFFRTMDEGHHIFWLGCACIHTNFFLPILPQSAGTVSFFKWICLTQWIHGENWIYLTDRILPKWTCKSTRNIANTSNSKDVILSSQIWEWILLNSFTSTFEWMSQRKNCRQFMVLLDPALEEQVL